MNKYFAEKNNLKLGGNVADINGAGLVGERVSMANNIRLAIVVLLGNQAAASITAHLKQHDAATGGNTKALEVENFTVKKIGTDTVGTQEVPSAPTADFTLSGIDNKIAILEIEVLSEDLDRNNGFSFVSVDIDDPAAAKVVGVLYDAHEVRYAPAYKQEM